MNKTQNYQLNQWEAGDKVRHEDFNADNAKIDAAIAAVDAKADSKADQTALEAETSARTAAISALNQALTLKGNCQFVYGSYQGTGKAGQNNPNRLTFSKKPIVLFVGSSTMMAAARCAPSAYTHYNGSCREVAIEWGERSVSWYSRSDDAGDQMNGSSYTYSYIALVET